MVSVQEVDGLGDHLHMPQLLGGNVQKQILDPGILDAEALGHILHSGLQFAVAAAQLLLQQCGVLRIGTFNGNRVE